MFDGNLQHARGGYGVTRGARKAEDAMKAYAPADAMPQWMAKRLEGLDALSIQEKLSAADDLPGVRVSGAWNV